MSSFADPPAAPTADAVRKVWRTVSVPMPVAVANDAMVGEESSYAKLVCTARRSLRDGRPAEREPADQQTEPVHEPDRGTPAAQRSVEALERRDPAFRNTSQLTGAKLDDEQAAVDHRRAQP